MAPHNIHSRSFAYAGNGSWLYKDKPNEVVIQNGVFSRHGCERVIRYAYELARKRKRL